MPVRSLSTPLREHSRSWNESKKGPLFFSCGKKLDSIRLRRDVAGLCQLYLLVTDSAPPAVTKYLKVGFMRVARTTRTSEATKLRALEAPKSRTVHHQRSFLPYYTHHSGTSWTTKLSSPKHYSNSKRRRPEN